MPQERVSCSRCARHADPAVHLCAACDVVSHVWLHELLTLVVQLRKHIELGGGGRIPPRHELELRGAELGSYGLGGAAAPQPPAAALTATAAPDPSSSENDSPRS